MPDDKNAIAAGEIEISAAVFVMNERALCTTFDSAMGHTIKRCRRGIPVAPAGLYDLKTVHGNNSQSSAEATPGKQASAMAFTSKLRHALRSASERVNGG